MTKNEKLPSKIEILFLMILAVVLYLYVSDRWDNYEVRCKNAGGEAVIVIKVWKCKIGEDQYITPE
jgi:hypothetical protein